MAESIEFDPIVQRLLHLGITAARAVEVKAPDPEVLPPAKVIDNDAFFALLDEGPATIDAEPTE